VKGLSIRKIVIGIVCSYGFQLKLQWRKRQKVTSIYKVMARIVENFWCWSRNIIADISINSKQIKDLNIRAETLKLVQERAGILLEL
jgi:hypothetical protein